MIPGQRCIPQYILQFPEGGLTLNPINPIRPINLYTLTQTLHRGFLRGSPFLGADGSLPGFVGLRVDFSGLYA